MLPEEKEMLHHEKTLRRLSDSSLRWTVPWDAPPRLSSLLSGASGEADVGAGQKVNRDHRFIPGMARRVRGGGKIRAEEHE